jgi:hypothetical protein
VWLGVAARRDYDVVYGGTSVGVIAAVQAKIEQPGLVFCETLPSTLPFPPRIPEDRKKGQPELIVPTGLMMSGRLDSNQRPPEPHSGECGHEFAGKDAGSSGSGIL